VNKGLGDTLEKIFKITGIKSLVKAIAGDDCGCDKRKKKLNKIVPYSYYKVLISEDQLSIMRQIVDQVDNGKNKVSKELHTAAIMLHNELFNTGKKVTKCGSCFTDTIKHFKKILK
tara:strand:+ start:5148 stop:5495 length:348 start_codon:yes stop_codon:yes gene_type:complete